MKTRIALGAGLLLTLSTAVAGTLMYGRSPVVQSEAVAVPTAITAATPVTPQMLATWSATDDSDDYIAPKVPI